MAPEITDKVNSDFEKALAELGQELTRLRRQRGAPPYDRILRRGEELMPGTGRCSKSTMSMVFNGKQYISLDKLLWLVRSVMSWDEYGDECCPPTRRDEALTSWRERWFALDALRAARRHGPASVHVALAQASESPMPHSSSASTAGGLAAQSEEPPQTPQPSPCGLSGGVCPDHGSTLHSTAGSSRCVADGCTRAWDHDRMNTRCDEPCTYKVSTPHGDSFYACRGHAIDMCERLEGYMAFYEVPSK
ncbi:hypothetical protein ACIBAH_32870 [Streptomyces sp. NPDC051445]|uniref:hypothetical protein n=1 Tax=Streptomyces sp. NPDC051445 TaxID=3365653 RepID=UPI003789313F